MRQDQILMRLARQFQLAPEQVRRRLSELRKAAQSRNRLDDEAKPAAIDYAQFRRYESELIQLLIQDPSLLDKAVENISPSQFVEGVLRDLYEVMGECFHDGKDVGYQQLMLELEEPKLKGLVDYLYDEAIDKKQVVEGQNSVYALDLSAQLDTVIAAFNADVIASGNQAQISRLHAREFDEREEAMALEELFQQQLQKLNKTK